MNCEEQYNNVKVMIRSRKSKNGQHNEQYKKANRPTMIYKTLHRNQQSKSREVWRVGHGPEI